MSVALVTMVYNDAFFLEVWLRHYRKYADPKDIYIITHGPQDYAHVLGAGCNVIEIPRDPRNPRLDQDRFKYLSTFCAGLTEHYDRVIWNDVDEIVVLDPDHGSDLMGYINALPPEQEVVSPFGLEIVHRADLENDYDYDRPMFAQRRYVRFNGWYTKPNIISRPITWGPDGHGSSHGELHLDPHLYTFHLKWFDQNFHINRHKDRLKMRFTGDDGEEVIVGAGSWSWSEATYMIASNHFLRVPILAPEDSFDYTDDRRSVIESFGPGNHGTGMFKINWRVGGILHHLPERFIGTV